MTAPVVAGPGPAVPLRAAAEVPVDPDRDTARQWAIEELSGQEYVQAQPSLLERIVAWARDRLAGLTADAPALDPGLGLLVGLAVVAVAVTVALLVTGPLRRTARVRRGEGVLADSSLTAAEHRELAEAAAARGDWSSATRERFRAVARALEERTVLDPRPGRTALEVAHEAGDELPPAAGPLRAAADVFDDVTYGERPGSEQGYLRVVDADTAAGAARPGAPAGAGR